MNENRSLVGPRGWAFVSLSLGALLAVPFLREPNKPQSSDDLAARAASIPWETPAVAPPAPAFSAHSAPAQSDPDAVFPSTSSVAWDTRAISGMLPTTAPVTSNIPDWVAKPSRLDEMIKRDESSASHQESLARANAVTQAAVREFRAWRNPNDRNATTPLKPHTAAVTPTSRAPELYAHSSSQSLTSGPNAVSPFADQAEPLAANPAGTYMSAIQGRPAAWSDATSDPATSNASQHYDTSPINRSGTDGQPPIQSNAPPSASGVVSATLRRSIAPLPTPATQSNGSTTAPKNFVYQPGLKDN